MVDYDTFLITLYVQADEFCKMHPLSFEERPLWPCGRRRALCRSEVLTLSIFGQWYRFRSERDFYRFAEQRLRPLFPDLPHRSQFVRAQAQYARSLTAFALHLAQQLEVAEEAPFEVIDRTGLATRTCSRRGNEWLSGQADKGYCGRLGYFWGFHLLDATTPQGVITGFALCPASRKDQPQATDFFALRSQPHPDVPGPGVHGRSRTYVFDKGFSGPHLHRLWEAAYGICVIGAPQAGHGTPWPPEQERWVARLRQIVETVHDKLLNFFRLGSERPHAIRGLFARLSAKVALHNFCIWMNRQLGRPNLAFATLLGWV